MSKAIQELMICHNVLLHDERAKWLYEWLHTNCVDNLICVKQHKKEWIVYLIQLIEQWTDQSVDQSLIRLNVQEALQSLRYQLTLSY